METPNYVYQGYVTKVVDGDTIDVILDLGFSIMHKTRLRFARIDTPELNSSDQAERDSAKISKQWVVDQCLDKEVLIQTTGKGKYGRYIAEIYTIDDTTRSLNDKLLDNGLAKLYT